MCSSFYDPSQSREEIISTYTKFASAGLRVLALAYGPDINRLTFVGLGTIFFSNVNLSKNIFKQKHFFIIFLKWGVKKIFP